MTRARKLAWHEAIGNAAVSALAGGIVGSLRTLWHYPLQSAMTAMLGAGLVFGIDNALWLQHGHHPMPFFTETAAVAEPVVPVARLDRASVRHGVAKPAIPAPVTETVAAIPAPTPLPDVSAVGNADVAALQQKLRKLGLFTGKIDGYYGPQTAAAIRAFETETGLPQTGALTPGILQAVSRFERAVATQPLPNPLPVSQPEPAPVSATDPVLSIAMHAAGNDVPKPVAEVNVRMDAATIRKVQTGLARLGFLTADISGRFDESTARAIREFETYNNYQVSGKLTPELIDLLKQAGAYD